MSYVTCEGVKGDERMSVAPFGRMEKKNEVKGGGAEREGEGRQVKNEESSSLASEKRRALGESRKPAGTA